MASQAHNASILTADASSILVAVNGWGLGRIAPSPDGRAYRLDGAALPSFFSGLSTGGAWSCAGGFLVQLYRDPFTEGAAAPRSGTRLLFVRSGGSEAAALDPFPADPGFELFALLPSGGSWFAELRKDEAERVDLKFYSLGDLRAPPAGSEGALREIRRAEFQEALSPRPLASLGGGAGRALRSALAALGKGPWLARLRSGSGSDAWYLGDGTAEEASPAFAWADGDRVLALRSDGWLAVSVGGAGTDVARIRAPSEAAYFTALAAAGDLVAAAWETGDFPEVTEAGIVALSIASSPARDTMKQ